MIQRSQDKDLTSSKTKAVNSSQGFSLIPGWWVYLRMQTVTKLIYAHHYLGKFWMFAVEIPNVLQ